MGSDAEAAPISMMGAADADSPDLGLLACHQSRPPRLHARQRSVLQVPETFASPVTCLMHGQAYLANIAAGRDPASHEAVKVICVRGTPSGVDHAESSH